jgi:hypothetical protein
MDPKAVDIIATFLATPGLPTSTVQAAEKLLVVLENAGFVVLDECARCHEDPRAHWCADLEETFN